MNKYIYIYVNKSMNIYIYKYLQLQLYDITLYSMKEDWPTVPFGSCLALENPTAAR